MKKEKKQKNKGKNKKKVIKKKKKDNPVDRICQKAFPFTRREIVSARSGRPDPVDRFWQRPISILAETTLSSNFCEFFMYVRISLPSGLVSLVIPNIISHHNLKKFSTQI